MPIPKRLQEAQAKALAELEKAEEEGPDPAFESPNWKKKTDFGPGVPDPEEGPIEAGLATAVDATGRIVREALRRMREQEIDRKIEEGS